MEQQKQKCVATSAESRSTGKRKVTVGSVWDSNKCGKFVVEEYKNANSVTVRFLETGFETTSTSGNIRHGEVRDKLSRSVYGVGIIGAGEYAVSKNGKQVRMYKVWKGMIERCYESKRQKSSPTYKGCSVFVGWHNYQNFAKWYCDNYPRDGAGYHIDKDLKVIGNKVYSPETCMFVSHKVNSFILCRDKLMGDFLVGVTVEKKSGRFVAKCNNPFTTTNEYLGCFIGEVEAHLAWRKRKSELAYELAMIQDREEVKQALLNWKDALDSNKIHPY
jgi:hypothetical protein